MQLFGCPCQQYGYWFLWRGAGQRLCYSVPPELHPHHADGGRTCRVGHTSDINIEGANREVGISRRLRYECLQDV